MEKNKLKISLQEIIISFILAGIFPVLINFGIKTFVTNPGDLVIATTAFTCGVVAVLAGLWSPVPLLGTSLLLGGSFLFGEAFFVGASFLSNSAILITMILIFGLLLLQLWHCSTTKQKLKASQADWYAALAIRESTISLIIPFLLPFIIHFGLATLGIHEYAIAATSNQLIAFCTYFIIGLISLATAFIVTIPSLSMSVALAAYNTLIYSLFFGLPYQYKNSFFELFIYSIVFCSYLAGLVWIHKNRKNEPKSTYIRIRNWATVLMPAATLPQLITLKFKLFAPHLDPTVAFLSYNLIALGLIVTGIWLGATYLGISCALGGAFVIAKSMYTLSYSLDKSMIFFLLLAISTFLGFVLWHFATKKKKE